MYNVFFQLERQFILQTHSRYEVDSAPKEIDDQVDNRPAKYRNIILPKDWYIVGANKKKRQDRINHGLISFVELTKAIASSWRRVDNETRTYVKDIADQLFIKYRREVAEYEGKYGKDALKSTSQKRKAKLATTTNTMKSSTPPKMHRANNGSPKELEEDDIASNHDDSKPTANLHMKMYLPNTSTETRAGTVDALPTRGPDPNEYFAPRLSTLDSAGSGNTNYESFVQSLSNAHPNHSKPYHLHQYQCNTLNTSNMIPPQHRPRSCDYHRLELNNTNPTQIYSSESQASSALHRVGSEGRHGLMNYTRREIARPPDVAVYSSEASARSNYPMSMLRTYNSSEGSLFSSAAATPSTATTTSSSGPDEVMRSYMQTYQMDYETLLEAARQTLAKYRGGGA
ncbi:predicted protein [Thalassiosira pseudonana CCMP1335]|uniref:HMG box domain-containing protein n=1 Tax=Thalassiosira pseudonana TaxID=35128 RepID=B5YP99_THAPS|nr:predicted protein [Thalassiosira pseudonana CCMP1335]ACI64764.1 predicted protein [Thalassiosira pseudonana CCMP1335]